MGLVNAPVLGPDLTFPALAKDREMRRYSDRLSAEVNSKGVLDVDTVKGCLAINDVDGGCYGSCYAAKIANFRGIDFSIPVVRMLHGYTHAKRIEDAVRAAPQGFFRVGTMGDPSFAWDHTINIVTWLAPFAVPVIVTKHWRLLDDGGLCRLIECGAVLNTSISALDTPAQLAHRERQIRRYAVFGGISVARIVSCDFNRDTPEGARMATIQDRLFNEHAHIIDNPLRVPRTHRLVDNGVIRVRMMSDLNSMCNISLARNNTYVGKCDQCPDLCGIASCGPAHPRPAAPQRTLFDSTNSECK